METSCIEYRWLCSSFNGNFRKPIWAQFECSSVVLLLVALTTFGFPGSSRSSLLSADWASHPASLCWRKYVRKVRSHDNWISLGKRLYILRSTTIFPELELGHRVPDPDPAIVVIAIIGENMWLKTTTSFHSPQTLLYRYQNICAYWRPGRARGTSPNTR